MDKEGPLFTPMGPLPLVSDMRLLTDPNYTERGMLMDHNGIMRDNPIDKKKGLAGLPVFDLPQGEYSQHVPEINLTGVPLDDLRYLRLNVDRESLMKCNISGYLANKAIAEGRDIVAVFNDIFIDKMWTVPGRLKRYQTLVDEFEGDELSTTFIPDERPNKD